MKLVPVLVAFALAVPSIATAAPPTDAELAACLGAQGATLAVFDGLRRGMTPAEAGALWPGADKPSKYGFAKVKAKNCVGAKTFVFYFQQDRKNPEAGRTLYNVQIEFDPKLSKDADFYTRFQAVLVGKYGPIKKQEDIERRLLTWASKDGIAQMTQHAGSPFKLSAPLAK